MHRRLGQAPPCQYYIRSYRNTNILVIIIVSAYFIPTYNRGYKWPLDEVVPNTPGWKRIMNKRFEQVRREEIVCIESVRIFYTMLHCCNYIYTYTYVHTHMTIFVIFLVCCIYMTPHLTLLYFSSFFITLLCWQYTKTNKQQQYIWHN